MRLEIFLRGADSGVITICFIFVAWVAGKP